MKQFVLMSFILLLFSACEKEDEIYENPGYAIGTVTKSTNVASVQTFYYEFTVDNKTYKDKKDGGISTSMI